MSEDRQAFVTGGSGFLGRRLVGYLKQRGFTVRALARSAAAQKMVADAGAEPVPGDLDSTGAMSAAMRGCEVVFHSAALADDWGDPAQFHRVNVLGTENVLAAARSARVPRLCHVSTEAVLVGGPAIVRADETWPLPAQPLGLYPLTKGQAEQRARAASSAELRVVVVRPRLIWGKDDTTMLARLCDAARKGQFMWIDGGRYLTSTCHVENVCEGMLLAAQHGKGGEVYFLTDGEPVEFRSFATRLLRTQGIELGSRSVPRWLAMGMAALMETTARTLGVPARPLLTRSSVHLIGGEVTVSDARARRELGYKALMSTAAGLQEMTV